MPCPIFAEPMISSRTVGPGQIILVGEASAAQPGGRMSFCHRALLRAGLRTLPTRMVLMGLAAAPAMSARRSSTRRCRSGSLPVDNLRHMVSRETERPSERPRRAIHALRRPGTCRQPGRGIRCGSRFQRPGRRAPQRRRVDHERQALQPGMGHRRAHVGVYDQNRWRLLQRARRLATCSIV